MSTTPPPSRPTTPTARPDWDPPGRQPPASPYQAPQWVPCRAPGPYGENPYGQPPPPPFPYGQQQPYGAPAPAAGPAPWGAAPPPPKKRRVGLVLGIVGGVVVMAVAILVAGLATVRVEVRHRLSRRRVRPDAAQDSCSTRRYELAEDLSDTQGQKIARTEADGAWDAKDTKAAVGQYSLGGDAGQGHARGLGHVRAVQRTPTGPRQHAEGRGGGERLPGRRNAAGLPARRLRHHRHLRGARPDRSRHGDHHPGLRLGGRQHRCASIAEITPDSVTKKPAEVDLAAAAETAVKIREEIRKPIG